MDRDLLPQGLLRFNGESCDNPLFEIEVEEEAGEGNKNYQREQDPRDDLSGTHRVFISQKATER